MSYPKEQEDGLTTLSGNDYAVINLEGFPLPHQVKDYFQHFETMEGNGNLVGIKIICPVSKKRAIIATITLEQATKIILDYVQDTRPLTIPSYANALYTYGTKHSDRKDAYPRKTFSRSQPKYEMVNEKSFVYLKCLGFALSQGYFYNLFHGYQFSQNDTIREIVEIWKKEYINSRLP